MSFVSIALGWIACGFLGLLAGTVIWFIWTNKLDLTHLINEANGQASMSRFQLLIFTFVIAISLFTLVEKRSDNSFPPIPDGVLTLLGISASTYAVGKGISYSNSDIMLATVTKPTDPSNSTTTSFTKTTIDSTQAAGGNSTD